MRTVELDPLPARPPGSVANRVLIVGAGLSGLAAATELERAGHDVTVLEARTRPGGRVRTVRDPFADGLVAELGAVLFSQAYTVANRYIDQLGLERREYFLPPLAPLYHLDGRRFSTDPDGRTDWPYELTEEERRIGPIGIVVKYLSETMLPLVPEAGSWRDASIAELDEISLAEYMRRQGASEGAIALLEHTQYFGPRPEEASALSVALADIALFYGGAGMFVLAGGNERLPTEMARRLRRAVQYGVEADGITSRGDGVEVSARRVGRTVTLSADRVIVTVPAPVLHRIRLEPALPAGKAEALESLPYRNSVRAQFQVRRRFWEDEGVAGPANTDLFSGRIDRQPYTAPENADERAVLEAFMEGPTADELAGRTESEILDFALGHLERVHPKIREFAEGGIVKAWGDDPYARSAWSWTAPGDVTRYLDELQRPVGRIHFAGEHTSVLRATMEGALRSGMRVAREVDDAAAR